MATDVATAVLESAGAGDLVQGGNIRDSAKAMAALREDLNKISKSQIAAVSEMEVSGVTDGAFLNPNKPKKQPKTPATGNPPPPEPQSQTPPPSNPKDKPKPKEKEKTTEGKQGLSSSITDKVKLLIDDRMRAYMAEHMEKTNHELRETRLAIGELGAEVLKKSALEKTLLGEIEQLKDSLRRSETRYNELNAQIKLIPEAVKALSALGIEVKAALRDITSMTTKVGKLNEISFETQRNDALTKKKPESPNKPQDNKGGGADQKPGPSKEPQLTTMNPAQFETTNQVEYLKNMFAEKTLDSAFLSEGEEEEEEVYLPQKPAKQIPRSDSITTIADTYSKIERMIMDSYTGKELDNKLSEMDKAMGRGTSAKAFMQSVNGRGT